MIVIMWGRESKTVRTYRDADMLRGRKFRRPVRYWIDGSLDVLALFRYLSQEVIEPAVARYEEEHDGD